MVRNGNLWLCRQHLRRPGKAWDMLQIQLGYVVLDLLYLSHRLVDDRKFLVLRPDSPPFPRRRRSDLFDM